MRSAAAPGPAPTLTAVEREEALGAIIAAYNDVTDRLKDAYERLQQEVRRLREELERKNEELRRGERLAALGEMAAGLAHEVRNPLGAIALQASLLERDLVDRPEATVLVSRIRAGVRTLDGLVGDVLSFAQEGRIECGPVALAELIDRTLQQVGPVMVARRMQVRIDCGPAGLAAWGDETKLTQVLANLLTNAAQAGGESGRITVTARTADDAVELCVEDDGPGIPAEHLERVFNPFFTTKADGTGLGLSIVHRIVEAHGGRIAVASAAGQGARFTIRLPSAAQRGGACLSTADAASRRGAAA